MDAHPKSARGEAHSAPSAGIDIGALRQQACALGPEVFASSNQLLYFVKRPRLDIAVEQEASRGLSPFDTQPLLPEVLREIESSLRPRFALLGSWASRWLVFPIRKRVDLFPDRISVGRTNASDIRLPFDFVSKLHAHLFDLGSEGLEVSLLSVNGMRVDGRELEQRTRVALRVGSRVEIGPLILDVVDGSGLHTLLVSDA